MSNVVRQGLFSERNELGKPGSGLVREAIPDEVRNFVRTYVEGVCGDGFGNLLWKRIVVLLDLDPDLVGSVFSSYNDGENTRTMTNHVRSCPFGQFLDICELLYLSLSDQGGDRSKTFRELLNLRLIRYYSAYRMDEQGKIVESGSQVGEQAIEQARALLRSPKLEGPDRQFQNALLAFHRVSSPDYEGAVAGALNAVEAVSGIAAGQDKVNLRTAVAKIRDEKGLHPRLANAIQSLHDYASNEGGRHGLVGDPKVDRPIAEFCLHQAAASIVLIARLYGYEVVEGG